MNCWSTAHPPLSRKLSASTRTPLPKEAVTDSSSAAESNATLFMVFQALVDLYFVQFHPAFGRFFVVHGELDGQAGFSFVVSTMAMPHVYFPAGRSTAGVSKV